MRQILFCLLLSLTIVWAIACVRKKPEPEKLVNPEWGKVIINPSLEENKKNWELWKSKGIKHYRYKTKITCEGCTLETYNKQLMQPDDSRIARGTSWITVEVSNKQVILVENIDGSPNHDFEIRLNIYKSDVIAIAFDWIEMDHRYEFNTRVAIYDANYGFPRYAEILPSKKGPTDIGHRIEIVEFEVLPELPVKPSDELKLNQ